jgi:hypothetical protein
MECKAGPAAPMTPPRNATEKEVRNYPEQPPTGKAGKARALMRLCLPYGAIPIQFSNSHGFALSPRGSREFCHQHSALFDKGAGNAGRSDSARSLVCKIKTNTQV